MEIKNKDQYNHSAGKYKMLSSASGVGSIITTNWGGFIMPVCINDWQFVRTLSQSVSDPNKKNWSLEKLQDETGVEIVDDTRFIEFLQEKKNFINLKCFAAIPHAQLDSWNMIDYKNNILYKEQAALGHNLDKKMFYIPAINFPRWFISSDFKLKRIEEWEEIWRRNKCNDGNILYFAPPRDPGRKTQREHKNQRLRDKTIYDLLTPVTLVLICPNGHLSDIDWYRYFCAKLDKIKVDINEFDLFSYPCDNHCCKGGKHELKWITDRNRSESWGVLKCTKCEQTVSLSGIMNLKPYCKGEKPWESEGDNDQCITDGHRTLMRVAMVTSNSIYYANCISSLYVPYRWTSARKNILSVQANNFLDIINKKYLRRQKREPGLTKEIFLKSYAATPQDMINQSIDEDEEITKDDYEFICNSFLKKEEDVDILGTYRLEEYKVFMQNNTPPEANSKLEFNDVFFTGSDECWINDYFVKVKQISTLALTNTQLGFGRVSMPTAKMIEGKVVYPDDQIRPIYSGNSSDVYVLPANQIYGEGLFFAFDNDKVMEWGSSLKEYYKTEIEEGSMSEFLYNKMTIFGIAKFYLLHTFSHLIMKELEFSCGYPTASLSERLYYSDEMCGVLIYTADGAEGSMGGLVWQGQSQLIAKIIKSALLRALDCSSDPLCWQNLDGLNRASCFSCTMVSETSCEQANMALDRRALVDEEFGFFREVVKEKDMDLE